MMRRTDSTVSDVPAEFKDGMLNIRLPKGEKPKAKSTEVKIS
jgi:HSP20 family molecular chaperone IbpA